MSSMSLCPLDQLTKATWACQNDDMLSGTELLWLKIQEAFEKEAL